MKPGQDLKQKKFWGKNTRILGLCFASQHVRSNFVGNCKRAFHVSALQHACNALRVSALHEVHFMPCKILCTCACALRTIILSSTFGYNISIYYFHDKQIKDIFKYPIFEQ